MTPGAGNVQTMEIGRPAQSFALTFRSLSLALTLAITAAFCIYVCSLPVFPSNDGPMHLYFTSIFKDLLLANGRQFGRFYTIKHLLPPYSLYYYLLILLSKIVSLAWADKLIICLYMVSFSLGLRFLTTTVGPDGDAFALLATPLLFNWPLAMGFVNFCLSTTMLFWALGLWIRLARRPANGKRIGFLLLVVAITLTHPVPLLFLLAFCGFDLAIRAWQKRVRIAGSERNALGSEVGFGRNLRSDLITLLLSSCALLYVKLFTVAHALDQQDTSSTSFSSTIFPSLRNYLTLRSLTPFYFTLTPGYVLFRFFLRVMLLAALLLACLQLRRWQKGGPSLLGRWSVAQTWACFAIGFCVLMPFIPDDLNHSHLFASRLYIYVWLAAIIAASGYTGAGKWLRYVSIALSLVLTVQTLSMARAWITPFARQLAAPGPQALLNGQHVGIMLYREDDLQPKHVGFNPYFWATAGILRSSGSVLYNTPWLDLPIIPIGAKPTLADCCFTPRQLESPHLFAKEITMNPEKRKLVFENIYFVIIVNGDGTDHGAALQNLFPDNLSEPRWACTTYSWYTFCERPEHP